MDENEKLMAEIRRLRLVYRELADEYKELEKEKEHYRIGEQKAREELDRLKEKLADFARTVTAA